MPQYLSQEAQSLLRCLFKRNPANRLGSGPGKGNEIKSHEFFASIDFDKLLSRSIRPPYIPAPNDPASSMFCYNEKPAASAAAAAAPTAAATTTASSTGTYRSLEGKEMHTDSPGVPASAGAYELFRGFSFVAPILLDDEMNGKSSISTTTTSATTATTSSSSSTSTRPAASELIAKQTAGSVVTPSPSHHPSLLRTSSLISKCKGRMISEYQFLEVIGKGSFSVCKRCVHTTTQQEYAVKIIEKRKRDCSEEVEVMLRFSEHPNIVTLHDVFEDQDHVYLFMDLLRGGELLDRILNVGFSERQASEIMEIIAKVVHFLHENGVSM